MQEQVKLVWDIGTEEDLNDWFQDSLRSKVPVDPRIMGEEIWAVIIGV